jgi:hypothetical protein
MNYGFVVTKDSIGDSRTKWSDDGKTILFWGHIVEMDDWKSFVLDLIGEAEEILAKKLMFAKDGKLPDVSLWSISDDQEKTDLGYYFAKDWAGGWDEARKTMGEWILQARDPNGLFGDQDEGGTQEFNQTAVDEYNALDSAF